MTPARPDPVSPASLLSLLSQVWRGSAVSLASRIAFALLAFGQSALLARALPVQAMGAYFVALSVAGFVSVALPLGLPGLALREVGGALLEGRHDRAAAWARAAVRLCLRAGLALLAAAAALALGCPACAPADLGVPAWQVLPLVAGLGALLALQSLLAEVFRAHTRLTQATLHGGTAGAAVGLAVVAIVMASGLPLSLPQALTIALAATGLNVAVACWCLPGRRLARGPQAAVGVAQARTFWAQGLATFVFFQADLWIAALVLPLEQVALYGAANRLVQALALPVEAAESALPPFIVRLLGQRQHAPLQVMLARVARGQALLVGLGLVLLLALAGPILGAVFGAPYAQAATVACVLGLGWLARAALGAGGQLLMLGRQDGAMARLTTLAALCALPLEWAAGQAWGATGIAAAAALVLATHSLAGAVMATRMLRINPSAFGRAAE